LTQLGIFAKVKYMNKVFQSIAIINIIIPAQAEGFDIS